jgi:hypothetical protein
MAQSITSALQRPLDAGDGMRRLAGQMAAATIQANAA